MSFNQSVVLNNPKPLHNNTYGIVYWWYQPTSLLVLWIEVNTVLFSWIRCSRTILWRMKRAAWTGTRRTPAPSLEASILNPPLHRCRLGVLKQRSVYACPRLTHPKRKCFLFWGSRHHYSLVLVFLGVFPCLPWGFRLVEGQLYGRMWSPLWHACV